MTTGKRLFHSGGIAARLRARTVSLRLGGARGTTACGRAVTKAAGMLADVTGSTSKVSKCRTNTRISTFCFC